MDQFTALDANGENYEWENVVNGARCRFERKQAEKVTRKRTQEIRRKLHKALLYATGAGVIMLMGNWGWIELWPAALAAQVLLCAACFVAGKVAGNREASNGR